MKNSLLRERTIAIAILFSLVIGYLAFIFGSSPYLPDQIATHFGPGGFPDDWTSRSGYVAFTTGFGLGTPLFVVTVCFLARFLPVWLVNVPHREFWLATKRRDQAMAVLLNLSLWLASLMVCFFGALHYLTIQGNRSTPARLPTTLFFTILLLFLFCLGIWLITLYRRFRPPESR